jgi:hypothetical protein
VDISNNGVRTRRLWETGSEQAHRTLISQIKSVFGMSSLSLNTILVVVILSTASLSIGYHLGARHSRLNVIAVQDAEDDNDEPAITDSDGDLSAVKAGLMEPCKMARPQLISFY